MINFAKQGWRAEFSNGVAIKHLDQGGIRFVIPAKPGHINYLLTREFFPLNFSRLHVGMTIHAQPGVVFSEDVGGNDPGPIPPTVRFLLFRDLDMGRWWSREGIELKPGFRKLSVPMADGAAWGGVLGAGGDVNGAFAKFRLGRARVGLSFGGGWDYGHGVQMSKGRASMTVSTFFGK